MPLAHVNPEPGRVIRDGMRWCYQPEHVGEREMEHTTGRDGNFVCGRKGKSCRRCDRIKAGRPVPEWSIAGTMGPSQATMGDVSAPPVVAVRGQVEVKVPELMTGVDVVRNVLDIIDSDLNKLVGSKTGIDTFLEAKMAVDRVIEDLFAKAQDEDLPYGSVVSHHTMEALVEMRKILQHVVYESTLVSKGRHDLFELLKQVPKETMKEAIGSG